MTADSFTDPQAQRRNWVVLLYFYLAALVGLGFVVTGATTALFGAKNALLPGLGISPYAYDARVPYEPYPGPERIGPPRTDERSEVLTERRAREARSRAIEQRRSSGIDGMLSGLIILAVGVPVLVWHLKRARAMNGGAAKPLPPEPPTPTEPPAAS